MNPISGTYRHQESGPSGEEFLSFLSDAKERDELFMVVDEELKMMSRVCDHGGRVLGPFVKQMSHLTHTEYLLTGSSDLDPREILRQTMFAPTVTGSPIQNAARVIEKYENSGRGYYSGVLALFTGGASGRSDVDAPILIRTAELTDDGENTALKLSVGATLVRGSTPADEVAETRSKLGGVLAALGITPARPGRGQAVDLASYPGVAQALSSRNESLASFWIDEQGAPEITYAGVRALVVDCEDQWTDMLAHQLRHLGMDVTIVAWNELLQNGTGSAPEYDLLVCGPGPGDPRRTGDTRIDTVEAIIRARLTSGLPLLAVCLSHQILARVLGLTLHALPTPDQGTQREIDLFGTRTTVGFYNTFVASMPGPPDAAGSIDFEISADPVTGAVHALRGNGFHSIQFHPESLLSTNGLDILDEIARRLLSSATVA